LFLRFFATERFRRAPALEVARFAVFARLAFRRFDLGPRAALEPKWRHIAAVTLSIEAIPLTLLSMPLPA
jgi:hypothetical protein